MIIMLIIMFSIILIIIVSQRYVGIKIPPRVYISKTFYIKPPMHTFLLDKLWVNYFSFSIKNNKLKKISLISVKDRFENMLIVEFEADKIFVDHQSFPITDKIDFITLNVLPNNVISVWIDSKFLKEVKLYSSPNRLVVEGDDDSFMLYGTQDTFI